MLLLVLVMMIGMMMSKQIDIDKLRELIEKATSGPWCDGNYGRIAIANEKGLFNGCVASNALQADLDAIVALRNAAPDLLDELERLRLVVARINEWTYEYGSELSPAAGWSDSYGDGVRACKERISKIIRHGEE